MKNTKIPFYKKKWFLYLSLIILPLFGVFILWFFHRDMAKSKKAALTAAAAVWFISIPFIGGGPDSVKSNNTLEPAVTEVTQAVSAESEQTALTAGNPTVTTAAEASESTTEPAVTTCSTAEETTIQTMAATTAAETAVKETTAKESTEKAESSETTREAESDSSSSSQNDNEAKKDEELYVLNTNTMKFHHSYCSSVDTIKEENYDEFYGTRDEVIAQGYTPCGRCHP